MTPALQPMDQGVICSLKAWNRNNVAQEMIEVIDSKKSFPDYFFVGYYENARPSIGWGYRKDRARKYLGFSEIEDDDAVSYDSFTALKDFITQFSILDETFENVTVEDVASLDDIHVSTQEPLSDADNLVSLLAVDIDDKHESNKDDSQSEVSEVLDKPNSPLPRNYVQPLIRLWIIRWQLALPSFKGWRWKLPD